jgi:hypothetical protein
MIMATKRAREMARVRWMATATKRAWVRAARGMATATRVVGDKNSNGASDREGNGNRRQQHRQ